MTTLLCPLFQDPQFTDNNEFLSGGLLWFYEAGSSTLADAYTTDAGDVAWSNPIVLNSRGETGGTIWLAAGQSYRIVLEGKPYYGQTHGVVITEHDDISGIPIAVEAEEWIPFADAPTYVSSTSFSVTGDYRDIFSSSRKLRITDSGGISIHSVTSSSFSAGVTIVNVDGTIDNGISTVEYSFITLSATPNRFDNIVAVSLNIAADAMINGNLLVVGSTTSDGPCIINDNLTVSGNASITGNVNTVPASQLLGGVFAGVTTMPAKGSLTLSNGIIIQWGSSTTDAVTHQFTADLTTTYVENIWYIGATPYSNSTQYSATAYPTSTSQIKITTFTGTTPTGSVPVWWMTIGK